MPVEKMSTKNIMCYLFHILKSKYLNDGFEKNIERAIALIIESGKTYIAKDPLRPRAIFASNLVELLIHRYEYKGFSDDLDHAVIAVKTTVNTMWLNDRLKVSALINLGWTLCKRSMISSQRVSTNLDDAIKTAEQILKLTKNDSFEIHCCINLVNNLKFCFDIRNDKNDLHRVIQILKNVLSVMSNNFSKRHLFLINQFFVYQKMYEITKNKRYFNDMIEFNHLTLNCTFVNTSI